MQLDLANTVVSGSEVSLLGQGSEGLLSILHLSLPKPFHSGVTLFCDGSVTYPPSYHHIILLPFSSLHLLTY